MMNCLTSPPNSFAASGAFTPSDLNEREREQLLNFFTHPGLSIAPHMTREYADTILRRIVTELSEPKGALPA